jgi:hypothetical protein
MRYVAVCLFSVSAAMFAQTRILSDESRANLHGPFSQAAEPFQRLFAGKLERIMAGETPHPLADRAAWAKMIEDSEANFVKRVEAEKAKTTVAR